MRSPARGAAGHGWLQRFPSNAANGSRMPSRRSTAVANPSPPAAAPSDPPPAIATAATLIVLRVTAREYTRRRAGGGRHEDRPDTDRAADGGRRLPGD